jgi:hypothetical protein
MATIKLTDFKAAVQDAARPNRFLVQMSGPWDEQMPYLVKTASLPNRTIGNIELNWQGMKAKIAGDPTFDDISMTFINDYDWNIKNFIEKWIEDIAQMATNERTDHANYKGDITMMQLGRTGEVIASYTLIGAFPISMDTVELSQDSSDTVEECTVSFTYDYFFRGTENNPGIATQA